MASHSFKPCFTRCRATGIILWAFVSVLGAWAFAVLALNNGETISATWMVVASICVYVIGYRFYSSFIANKVFELDENRATPAIINNNGSDFVPTNKVILFGHHFAAIAGAGPLVGPILAAQMGYLPGMLWLLVGVVFAGAVHDFIVLFISTRRNGKSLGQIIKDEMGLLTGAIAMFGIFFIMVIIIAILAMVVVNALAESPWGLFTIAMTIPIAVFMGIYIRFLRPGCIMEASIIGFVLLILALYYGYFVGQEGHPLYEIFMLKKTTLAILVMIYGFVASVLPVWILLAPRDYLSTFLKIGVIVIMAAGIIIVAPDLQMPRATNFIDGTGPVFAGPVFPFLFVTIACGTISGFHASISSGTTPKMIERETHARSIGYGAMLMESLVGIMALIAACVLEPSLYFGINSPLGFLDPNAISGMSADMTVVSAKIAQTMQTAGFVLRPEILDQAHIENTIVSTTTLIGEPTIISKTGGAPTFAIGLAMIMHQIIGGDRMMAFWYHFAILFEALFILTAVDAGTRAGKFIVQDALGSIYKPIKNTNSLFWSCVTSAIFVAAWGYLLYQGAIDPMGGIYTLWPLFGTSNQMLAAIALMLSTVVLFKMGKAKYSFITIVPGAWVLLTTLYAAFAKLFPMNGERVHDAVSHVAVVQKQSAIKEQALDAINQIHNGVAIMVDEKGLEVWQKILDKANVLVHNNLIDAILATLFIIVTFFVLFATIRLCVKISNGSAQDYPLREEPYRKLSDFKVSI